MHMQRLKHGPKKKKNKKKLFLSHKATGCKFLKRTCSLQTRGQPFYIWSFVLHSICHVSMLDIQDNIGLSQSSEYFPQ